MRGQARRKLPSIQKVRPGDGTAIAAVATILSRIGRFRSGPPGLLQRQDTGRWKDRTDWWMWDDTLQPQDGPFFRHLTRRSAAGAGADGGRIPPAHCSPALRQSVLDSACRATRAGSRPAGWRTSRARPQERVVAPDDSAGTSAVSSEAHSPRRGAWTGCSRSPTWTRRATWVTVSSRWDLERKLQAVHPRACGERTRAPDSRMDA
jgi:hypothetical protein